MAAAPDFSALEAKIRERADRQIESLKTIQATHAEIEEARATFLAEDAERVRKLNAALSAADGVFTAKELKAWTVKPLTAGGPARRSTSTRKKSSGRSTTSAAIKPAAGPGAGAAREAS